MIKHYKWTFTLTLLTIPLLFIAVLFMGGGHGSYKPAIILFPFGLIGILLSDTITLPFIILGVIQYPVYGFIIDKVKATNKIRFVLPLLLFIHTFLAFGIIKLAGENWK
jgi:hypothetical protein